MREFLNMGGYASYVWSAYGLAAIVIAWNVIAAFQSARRARMDALRRLSMGGEAGE